MLQCLMVKVKKTQKKVQMASLLLVTKLNFPNNYILCVSAPLHSTAERA